MNGRRLLLSAAAALITVAASARAEAPEWLARAEALPDPAKIQQVRPFTASYRVTWSGIIAARAEIECTLPPDTGQVRTQLKTSTAGLARSLWQMDTVHTAIADRRTIRPIRIDETDKRETKEIDSRVEFPPGEAIRWTRTIPTDSGAPSPGEEQPKFKPKRFEYPNLLDMHTALLNLRNVPLAAGESHTVLVMTVTSPYLVTIKVAGREKVELKSGKRAAIKCSVSLGKISKEGQLQPQKKFKAATVWISDDPDHTLLKVEAKVFVGTVLLELEHITFTDHPQP